MNHEKEWNRLRDLIYKGLHDISPDFTQIDVHYSLVLMHMLTVEANARGINPENVTDGVEGVLYLYRLLH